MIALIGAQVSAGTIDVDPMHTIISAIPYQLYGIFSILLVVLIIILGKDESSTINTSTNKRELPLKKYQVYDDNNMPKAENSIIPIVLLVSLVMGIIIVTGDGATGIYVGAIEESVTF